MDNLLDVAKGLHLDFHPISQPTGTYTYLLNGIRILSGAIENERGTIDIRALGKKVIGGYVLDTEIVLFLFPSEIGVINKSEIYTKITDNPLLNLVDNNKLTIEGKKLYNKERVVYFVDGVNPNRRLNLDDGTVSSVSFQDDIKLQLTPDITTITIDGVIDGGSLPTGVYQATARLLTRSTNTAPFGFLSSLVSIIDDSDTLPFNDIDGAVPQSASSKAIQLTVNNIDSGYEFIEIVIVTYVGTANISRANIVARLPIEGRSSISFVYSSVNQNKEAIDLGAITIKPLVYDTAECIVQKDNILVLSNLTASNEIFDFQPVANKVKLKYFIEEVLWQPGYKNVLTSALKRGYLRNEVYSFAITPNFGTSYNTTAYHVAAPISLIGGNRSPANTVTKELGTYTSNLDYPSNRNYPTLGSTKVRHFIMPTLLQEPMIVTRNGQIYIRILGIQADFTQAIPLIPELTKKNLRGFSIVRQQRLDDYKSILTQGIAQIHNSTSIFIGSSLTNTSAFVSPGAGNANYSTNMGYIYNSILLGKEVAFYSPESIFYKKPFIGVTNIEPVARLVGTQTIVGDQRTLPEHDGDQARFFHSFLDYSEQVAFITPKPIRTVISGTIQYISNGGGSSKALDSDIPLMGVGGGKVTNYKSNGYLYLKLTDNLPIDETTYGQNGYCELRYDDRSNRTDLIFMNNNELTISNTSDTSTRYLYNLTRMLSSQYGNVFDATYMFCSNWNLSTNLTHQFFGGDTFINKFSVISAASSATGFDRNNIDFKTLNYFFVESGINTDLRHYNQPIGVEGQSGFIPGTMPYYPKYSIIYDLSPLKAGLLNLSWALGHSAGYNKQYSFENSIISYSPKQLAETIVVGFENRSIYSEQSAEGEQLDSFRVFLPNNYHDIPRDRGVIKNTFISQNNIHLHTTGALYRGFFNEKITQASSIGQVYLGTGGVFDRPSEPIYTVAGGYAGTQGKWGISTPAGYFFIDARQKKVFLLGNQVEDLAGQGLDNFFSDMEETDKFSLVYDYKEGHNRLILSSSKGWTLTYQIKLKSWTGFHSYNPYFMISRGQDTYMAHDTTFYKHNVGRYGEYFNVYHPLQLEYVFNLEAKTTKSFDNIVLHSSTYGFNLNSGIKEHKIYETFTNLRVYNELKDTGTYALVVPKNFEEEWTPIGGTETFAKEKDQEFRIAIPMDRLEDPSIPEVYTTNPDFRPRMTGKWAKFKWTFNKPNRHFILHTLETLIRGIAR